MPATPLFMSLTTEGGGSVIGESEVDGFEGWIELDDWNWGATFQQAEGDGRDEVVPTKFSFAKPPDRSSTVLMKALNSGKPFPKARICFSDWAGKDFELWVELSNMRMVTLSMTGSLSDASADLDEHWECDFNSIKFKHLVKNQLGQKVASDAEIMRPPNASLSAPKRERPRQRDDQDLDEEGAGRERGKGRDAPSRSGARSGGVGGKPKT